MIKRILYWALLATWVTLWIWTLFWMVYLIDNEMYIHATILAFVVLTISFACLFDDEDISPPF